MLALIAGMYAFPPRPLIQLPTLGPIIQPLVSIADICPIILERDSEFEEVRMVVVKVYVCLKKPTNKREKHTKDIRMYGETLVLASSPFDDESNTTMKIIP